MQKIITDAIEGEDADELGARIFDLSPNGCNLKIKVEKQGDYPSYVSSKFSMPSALPEVDDAKAGKVYGGVFELDKIFTLKSSDELKTMLDEHYHCKIVKDDTVHVAQPAAVAASPVTSKSNDDDIKSLLDGLDINA